MNSPAMQVVETLMKIGVPSLAVCAIILFVGLPVVAHPEKTVVPKTDET